MLESPEAIIRCSSLGAIMTEPRTKIEGPLSQGAKTAIRKLAAQAIFGVDFEFTSKECEKGTQVEPESIALLNRVRGLSLVKNSERLTVNGLTGEPDCIDRANNRGHDTKSPWSLATFPLTPEVAEDKAYEWQARGYMALFNVDRYEINFCMVDTPEELIRYEPLQLHCVSHIPEHMRVTTVCIERDAELEAAIWTKVAAAKTYFHQVIEEFHNHHKEIA